MRNLVGDLLKAYYQALNGMITYDSQTVNVYVVGVNANDTFHYIQLRPESESDQSNKSSFVTNPIIVMDILTVHDGSIDYRVVEDIDDQARQLIFAGLALDEGQVLNVRAESSTYLDGFNGTRHEQRKVTRFFNRLNQQ